MKYSTIEIKPKPFDEEGWSIFYYDIPHDREEQEPHPSSLGFFHYPTKWGVQKGFDMLKQHMIDRHKAEIEALEKSLVTLETLKLK